MSTPFDAYTDFPKHWNDGLKWEKDTKPTFRHVQAILLACCERQYLTKFETMPKSVVDKMLHYQPKTFENLADLVSYMLDLTIKNPDAYIVHTGGSIRPSPYFASAGKSDFCFPLNDMYWYCKDNEELVLDIRHDYENEKFKKYSRLDFYIINEAINKFYRDNYPKSKNLSNQHKYFFTKYKRIVNSELMEYLIAVKNLVNGYHQVVLRPDFFSWYGFNESAPKNKRTFVLYDNRKDEDRPSGDENIKGFQTEDIYPQPPVWSGSTYRGTCADGYYDCFVTNEGSEREYYTWQYGFTPHLSTNKIINKSNLAFDLQVHWWEWAREGKYDSEDNYVEEYFNPDENFHQFSKIKQRGWNDLGIIKPDEDIEVFTREDCQQEPTTKPYWMGWSEQKRDIYFEMGMDAILLDFGVEGGFNFYEKTE